MYVYYIPTQSLTGECTDYGSNDYQVATYTFLGAGGLFFGGELGLMTGTFRAKSQIAGDRESRDRIQAAFRKFQADALRTQANMLDQDRGGSYAL